MVRSGKPVCSTLLMRTGVNEYVYYESSNGQFGRCGEWTVSPGDDLLFRIYLAGDGPRPMAKRCEECLALPV